MSESAEKRKISLVVIIIFCLIKIALQENMDVRKPSILKTSQHVVQHIRCRFLSPSYATPLSTCKTGLISKESNNKMVFYCIFWRKWAIVLTIFNFTN